MNIQTFPDKYSGYIKVEQGVRAGDFIPVVDVRDGDEVRKIAMRMIKQPSNGSKFFRGGYHRDKTTPVTQLKAFI